VKEAAPGRIAETAGEVDDRSPVRPEPPEPRGLIRPRGPLTGHPVFRIGTYAWAVIGVALLLYLGAIVLGRLSVVIVPLVLALFPAAVLAPPTKRLKDAGLPASAAALLVLVSSIALVAGVFTALAPNVQAELGDLGDRLQEGYEEVDVFLARGPFGFEPIRLDEVVELARQHLGSTEGIGEGAVGVVTSVVEGVAEIFFGLFALFFYLKDGPRMAAWLRDLFPRRARADAEAIGARVWFTIGAYIRGQLVIAVVDAVLIGLGLWIVGVPLALPLAVLVFFGGLFPIVGAVAAGIVAVLVALATGGLTSALIVLAIVVAVQQVEGHLLAPIVLGKATELHPVAVIAALTAGAVLLGVLGAFLAVPIAASATRAFGYLRTRVEA
jgi:predicted PurR-regulated permease PerM